MGFSEVRIGVAPAMISVICLPKMRASEASEAFLRGNRFPRNGGGAPRTRQLRTSRRPSRCQGRRDRRRPGARRPTCIGRIEAARQRRAAHGVQRGHGVGWQAVWQPVRVRRRPRRHEVLPRKAHPQLGPLTLATKGRTIKRALRAPATPQENSRDDRREPMVPRTASRSKAPQRRREGVRERRRRLLPYPYQQIPNGPTEKRLRILPTSTLGNLADL